MAFISEQRCTYTSTEAQKPLQGKSKHLTMPPLEDIKNSKNVILHWIIHQMTYTSCLRNLMYLASSNQNLGSGSKYKNDGHLILTTAHLRQFVCVPCIHRVCRIHQHFTTINAYATLLLLLLFIYYASQKAAHIEQATDTKKNKIHCTHSQHLNNKKYKNHFSNYHMQQAHSTN